MIMTGKFQYNGVFRRVAYEPMTFGDLKAELAYLFSLPDDFDVGIEVKDEDGDWIRVCVFFLSTSFRCLCCFHLSGF
jgi:hypothetical protein